MQPSFGIMLPLHFFILPDKQQQAMPVDASPFRSGVDNNTTTRRHLALNPEAVAPTPPEYLAPWLYFGKPNIPTVSSAPTVPSHSESAVPSSPSSPPATTSTATAPTLPVPAEQSSPAVPAIPPVMPSETTAPVVPAETEQPAVEEDNKAGLPQEKDRQIVVRGFDNSVIRNLNRRLEDPDWQKRAEASNDFSMILGANPNLERRPAYKPYIDAFMLKILRDSSAVVHEPALRSIQVGYYRHPTQAVINELTVLKTSIGLFGLEPQMVTDALYALYEFQQQEQQEAKMATQQKQQKKPDSAKPKAPVEPQVQMVN